MKEFFGRDLGVHDLAALVIDGVHIDDHVLLVALGVDVNSTKHVLGIREGATENATALHTASRRPPRARPCDEQDDALRARRGEAIRKAVVEVVGERAPATECNNSLVAVLASPNANLRRHASPTLALAATDHTCPSTPFSPRRSPR